jgi:very-short-patch-repair endonuclease
MPRRKTHAEYTEECRIKRLDPPVDDERGIYTGSKELIIHLCSRNHEYPQRPGDHLKGHGCSACAFLNRTKTHDQYAQECKAKNLDPPVDDERGRYKDNKTIVMHLCYKAHEYPQRPTDHLSGKGCNECARLNRSKTHDEYVEECRSKGFDPPIAGRYGTIKDDLIHRCVKNHDYPQRAGHHLQGHGCPTCAQLNRTKTHDEYVEECRVKGLDLPVSGEDGRYKSCGEDVTHQCVIGHTYPQRPNTHLGGHGCPTCYQLNRAKTHDEYVEECRIKGLDLPVEGEAGRYKGDGEQLTHRCPADHDYRQTANNHLQGSGCPMCKNKTTALLYTLLKSLGYTVIPEQRFKWTLDPTGTYRPRRFDFYIPELNILIELDGPHHFYNVGYARVEHADQLNIDCYEKMVPGLRHGFSFLRISQPDLWGDKNGTIKQTIQTALNQHKPTERVILTIAKDLSIYNDHLELTDRYYNDVTLRPTISNEDLS